MSSSGCFVQHKLRIECFSSVVNDHNNSCLSYLARRLELIYCRLKCPQGYTENRIKGGSEGKTRKGLRGPRGLTPVWEMKSFLPLCWEE